MSQLLTIGLERAEVRELRDRVNLSVIAHDMVPKVQIRDGKLFALHPDREQFVPVAKVIFHGIFEDDLPTLAALALWGGPCLPGAHGMLDCRPRIANPRPCPPRVTVRRSAPRVRRREHDLPGRLRTGRQMGRVALR